MSGTKTTHLCYYYYYYYYYYYPREALVLGESEAVAKDHFRAKLHDARKNAWSTSLNWYVHGLAKDNRQ